jgi:acetyltransferase-like isoleucine patch superfamily enzyme/2-polyprenyl-3-methyl-5-hydroxy-6-metoxy-1,4-benzoquinol methylase
LYFGTGAPFWQQVYQRADPTSVLYRSRLAIALRWIDELQLPASARVLDVGAGAGSSSVELARRGFMVDAIDPVEAMVALIQQQAATDGVSSRVEAMTGDVHALEMEAETYDLVLALGVVPWLHTPSRGIQEMARVLKPAGYAIVSGANRSGLPILLDPMHNPWLEPVRRVIADGLRRLGLRRKPRHEIRPRVQSLRAFDRQLEQAGLKKVRGQTYGFGPLSFLNHALPHALDHSLQTRLQALADRRAPVVRSAGNGYLVLARKPEADVRPRIHPTADVSPAARVGARSRIWNEAQVREGARIGADCIIGKGAYVDVGVPIGNRVKLENRVSVFQGAVVADGVFIGPHSCLLNDKRPRAITADGELKLRHDWQAQGVRVDEGASIGGGCTILPGVHIGRFAMIGAGAIVTRDVPDFGLVIGNPARLIGYACECGARLNDNGTCPACGRQHTIS